MTLLPPLIRIFYIIRIGALASTGTLPRSSVLPARQISVLSDHLPFLKQDQCCNRTACRPSTPSDRTGWGRKIEGGRPEIHLILGGFERIWSNS